MENKILSYEKRIKAIRDRGAKFVEEYGIELVSKYKVPASKQTINIIQTSDMNHLYAIGKEMDEIKDKYEALKKKAIEVGILSDNSDEDYYFPFGRE